MRSRLWDFFDGVFFVALTTETIIHAQPLADLLPALDGRCRWCGYRRDHPIVVHDDLYAECGWRRVARTMFHVKPRIPPTGGPMGETVDGQGVRETKTGLHHGSA